MIMTFRGWWFTRLHLCCGKWIQDKQLLSLVKAASWINANLGADTASGLPLYMGVAFVETTLYHCNDYAWGLVPCALRLVSLIWNAVAGRQGYRIRRMYRGYQRS